MKTIINHELAGRSESELSVLFHIVSRHLALTAPCSPERRNALASLENIRRARLAAMMARLDAGAFSAQASYGCI